MAHPPKTTMTKERAEQHVIRLLNGIASDFDRLHYKENPLVREALAFSLGAYTTQLSTIFGGEHIFFYRPGKEAVLHWDDEHEVTGSLEEMGMFVTTIVAWSLGRIP